MFDKIMLGEILNARAAIEAEQEKTIRAVAESLIELQKMGLKVFGSSMVARDDVILLVHEDVEKALIDIREKKGEENENSNG